MRDVKLAQYLEDAKTKSFEWGVLDCVLFSCLWVEVMTGENPAEDCVGAYSSEAEAQAFMVDRFGTIEAGLDAALSRVDIAFRQKGDLALCLIDGKETLGIVGGCGFVFFKSLGKGINAKKNPEILAVWRVQCLQ